MKSKSKNKTQKHNANCNSNEILESTQQKINYQKWNSIKRSYYYTHLRVKIDDLRKKQATSKIFKKYSELKFLSFDEETLNSTEITSSNKKHCQINLLLLL